MRHKNKMNTKQLLLRRDIAKLCAERKENMSYKEMLSIINDIRKALKKLKHQSKRKP